MENEILKISIKDLVLWNDNVRYNHSAKSEEECLYEMFENKKLLSKQKRLLDDIFLETKMFETCIVYKEVNNGNSKFIVLDGNRRISLFKIFFYDDLVQKYKLDYSKLEHINSNIKTINCQIYDDLDLAYKHVEKRHLGEQGGSGTVPWDSANKERMKILRGNQIDSIGYKILEFYNSTNKEEFLKVKRIVKHKSTLDRIFNSKYVYADIFGLENSKQYDLYNVEHQMKINEMLIAFYTAGGKVDIVYHVEKGKELFKNIESINRNKQITIDKFISNNNEKELPQLDFNDVDSEKKYDTPKSSCEKEIDQDLTVRYNKYTCSGAKLFMWTSKGIHSNNTTFDYYFGKLLKLGNKNGITNDFILDVAPYFQRLLLDISIHDLTVHINSLKGQSSKLKSSFDFNPFNTTSNNDSFVNLKKLLAILNLPRELKVNNAIDVFKPYYTILNKENFTVNREDIIAKFVIDLNSVIHGSNTVFSNELLEKYDLITITLIQLIYTFINLK